MTLQDICTSLETSRKLAEAGFEQENGFFWYNFGSKEKPNWKVDIYPQEHKSCGRFRAYTFNELWELLPNCIEYDDEIYYKRFLPPAIMIYVKGAEPRWLKKYEGNNPQEAAAELLLWCKQNGYLND